MPRHETGGSLVGSSYSASCCSIAVYVWAGPFAVNGEMHVDLGSYGSGLAVDFWDGKRAKFRCRHGCTRCDKSPIARYLSNHPWAVLCARKENLMPALHVSMLLLHLVQADTQRCRYPPALLSHWKRQKEMQKRGKEKSVCLQSDFWPFGVWKRCLVGGAAGYSKWARIAGMLLQKRCEERQEHCCCQTVRARRNMRALRFTCLEFEFGCEPQTSAKPGQVKKKKHM